MQTDLGGSRHLTVAAARFAVRCDTQVLPLQVEVLAQAVVLSVVLLASRHMESAMPHLLVSRRQPRRAGATWPAECCPA